MHGRREKNPSGVFFCRRRVWSPLLRIHQVDRILDHAPTSGNTRSLPESDSKIMACSRKAAGLPRPMYRLARAGGASTAAVVSTPMLPPAFLAPAAFTQAFSTQSPARAVAPRSQSRSQSNGPTVSSAHNLKAVLRRLGKSNKWSETAPDQSLDSPEAARNVNREASSSILAAKHVNQEAVSSSPAASTPGL